MVLAQQIVGLITEGVLTRAATVRLRDVLSQAKSEDVTAEQVAARIKKTVPEAKALTSELVKLMNGNQGVIAVIGILLVILFYVVDH